MLEEQGDLWEAHDLGYWVVVTTNGDINAKGECVMGRGVALQAKRRFPALPKKIGGMVKLAGSHVAAYVEERVITFPVKYHYYDRADMRLIERSARELAGMKRMWDRDGNTRPRTIKDLVYMVRPGCGNGGLEWSMVKPVIEPFLDDHFIVVEK